MELVCSCMFTVQKQCMFRSIGDSYLQPVKGVFPALSRPFDTIGFTASKMIDRLRRTGSMLKVKKPNH